MSKDKKNLYFLLFFKSLTTYKNQTPVYVYLIFLSCITLQNNNRNLQYKINLMDILNLKCKGYSHFLPRSKSVEVAVKCNCYVIIFIGQSNWM